MRPVSARFLAAVAGSARVVSRARVVPPGLNGVDPDPGSVLAELNMISGSATFDSTADVRSMLELTVTGNHWPKTATDALTPYGNEIFVETGIVFGDGSREFVSLGYFRIKDPEQEDAPDGPIQVTAPDRMQGIIDDRIPYPLTFTVGTLVTDVISSVVLGTYSWATFDLDDALTGLTLATTQITTEDRYGFLNDLVKSYGMVMYWDYRGVFKVAPPPDPNDTVATISSGAKGVLVQLSRSLTRDGINNGVVASGEQLDDTVPPVSAIVVDSDPNSPTYWFGQFGHVLQFFSSSFLTTTDQCKSAAQSILMGSAGLPYEVDFGQVPNPALEALDPVIVGFSGRKERHVLSQLVIPLDAVTLQTGQTRQLVNGVFDEI